MKEGSEPSLWKNDRYDRSPYVQLFFKTLVWIMSKHFSWLFGHSVTALCRLRVTRVISVNKRREGLKYLRCKSL